MLLTVHVAAVAYVIRSLGAPSTLMGTLIGVTATISVALFFSWPLGRAIASAFDPGHHRSERDCPRCGRREVRPLLRAGAGLFQPVTAYRCVACRTTFRIEGDRRIEEPRPTDVGPLDPSSIAYLSDPAGEAEIRFLDGPCET